MAMSVENMKSRCNELNAAGCSKKLLSKIKESACGIGALCLMTLAIQAAECTENESCRWVASDSYNASKDWGIPSFAGRDFWFLIREDGSTRKKMLDVPGVANEEFVKESGMSCVRPSPSRNDDRLVIVREIEILDQNGKDITKNIEISNPGAAMLNELKHLTDGDVNSFCYTSAQPKSFEAQVALKFRERARIKEIKISHGYNRCENDQNPIYCLSSFNIQYWDGSGYRNLPGMPKESHLATEDILLDEHIDTDRIKLFFSAGSKERVKGDDKLNAPFYFNGGRYNDGDFSGMREIKRDFSRYHKLKEMNPGLCLGFWLGEWENDINWGRGAFKMSLLAGFLKQHGDLLKKYPLTSLPPKTREGAVELLEDIYKKQKEILCNDAFGVAGTFCWDHHNLEWGGNLAGIELTGCGGIPTHNILTVFCRGAARQYRKPWMLYQAYFYDCAYPNTLAIVDNSWEINPNGVDYGIPVSLTRRGLYHAFYGGATFFDFELPETTFLTKGDDALYKLSPHGKMLREMYSFAKQHPDRGVPYTPIAFVLDYLHGWTAGGYGQEKVWFSIPFRDGDYMTREIMNYVWPFNDCSGFRTRIDQSKNICSGLVNTPYGDIFDALVANPPSGVIDSKTLDNYKVLFLLGDIRPNASLARKLMDYVKTGGTVVINCAQLDAIYPENFIGMKKKDIINTPDGQLQKVELLGAKALLMDDNTNEPTVVKNVYGRGGVITTLQPWLVDKNRKPSKFLGRLLAAINAEVLPFKIEGDIGYQINRSDNAWVVILMNNKGIIKDPRKPEEFDPSQTAIVRIRAKFPVVMVKELLKGEIVETADRIPLLTVSLVPGDVKILSFMDRKNGGAE